LRTKWPAARKTEQKGGRDKLVEQIATPPKAEKEQLAQPEKKNQSSLLKTAQKSVDELASQLAI
jgi:hypothetical protein